MPYKTLVEVYDLPSISMQVRSTSGSLCTIPFGYTSAPIEIYTPNPPDSNLDISLSLLNTSITGVTFLPSSMSFLPTQQYKYFQISISSSFSYNVSLSPVIYYSFILAGDNVLSYSQLSLGSFQVTKKITTTAPKVTALAFTDITQTSLNVKVTLDTSALVY